MNKEKNGLYRGPARRLAAAGMLALAVGLVMLSGWWYTAARRDRLTAHPAAVETVETERLPIPEEAAAAYGVVSVARALDGRGTPTGYVLVAVRQGYKSPIRVQCTFTVDGGLLAGIRILSQDETEYLGSRITAESFTGGFSGRLLPVKLWTSAAPGSPVDGLTGSTVSAQAVVDAVNGAHRFLQEFLAT